MKRQYLLVCALLQVLGASPALSEERFDRNKIAEPAAPAMAQSNKPLVAQGTNTTPDNDGGTIVVQNSNSDARSVYQITIPPSYVFADNIRSTVRLDGGSQKSVQHMSAYAAYVHNKCPWGKSPHECNGVGLFSQGIAGIDTAQTWPINTACNDNGYIASCGNEHDVTVQNGSAVYTLWAGIIQGAVQPGNANGIQLSQVPGATAQWTYGFVTGDGAVRNFGSVGALARAGSNVPSQPMWFNGFDGQGRVHAVKLQSLNHTLNITDNTTPDGLSFATGNGKVAISAIGASRDANLSLSCAGSCSTYIGSVATNVLAVSGSENAASPANWSAKLGTAAQAWSETNTKILNLKATTYQQLPRCDKAQSGAIAFINDAAKPITTWHQAVTDGGGTNTAFISCNGDGWHAFDH